MKNEAKFNRLREQYPDFIFEKYDIIVSEKNIRIKYYFKIPNLITFTPELIIDSGDIKINYNEEYLDYLVFQIGLIELISYCKSTCSKNIIIKANYINEEQIKFLRKLYYNGLGEFLYTNGITITKEELFNITCQHNKIVLPTVSYKPTGNLIAVGGGKDSCVTLELLKNEKNNTCFIINPKYPSLETAHQAGYQKNDIVKVERIIDKKIIKLNEKGFLNGHTPFSAIVAFTSYLCAYLQGKKNIILSNESSANEATVPGTNINHQYSKSFEFEKDFTEYINNFIHLNINYFSLLRGLSEFNIARLFSKYTKYHQVFKSCNLGSKSEEWNWCCNCPKCLFVYIILSPFLSKEERINIFSEELYEREDLLNTFLEIVGYRDTKPFECVGTYSEARYAVSLVISNYQGTLPYLLKYYKKNFPLELDGANVLAYNDENNLDKYYNDLVKKEMMKCV